MFGLTQFARRAFQWRSIRERNALNGIISNLPLELQKDIGWPAPLDRPSVADTARDIRAQPSA